MLRPEQMSKVSVTGSKRVVDDVIEAIHSLHLLDLSDYDDSWESFEGGRSLEGAKAINEQLVTVRALESTLDIDAEDGGQTRIVDREELNAELPTLRDRINELDDRRSELNTQIREVEEEIESVAPFAELGVDLDLLSGYDSLGVLVGQGDRSAIEAELDGSETINRFEIFSGGNTHAIFGQPAGEETADSELIADALVGVEFTTLSVPDADDSPAAYVAELEEQKESLETEREEVESELESIKADSAGFLLAAEEYLTIEAQKKEAPLSFATTENAFIAEGWIPTEAYDRFESTLTSEVEGPLEIQEIKRADYNASGHAEVEHDEPDEPDTTADADTEPAAAETESGEPQKARADGGVVTTDDEPPVVQSNPGVARPFEALTKAVSRPKYSEFDPTLLVFLTFPLMFGFMIGDIGYGVLYAGIGVYMYTKLDGVMQEMGAVAIWAGLFTILFGIYYGIDLFGYHAYPWLGIESWPISKGLSPGASEWALAWLVASALFGILHLNIGYALSFVSNYQLHDLKHAIYESASWLLLLNGLWAWIFSQHVRGQKPDFIFDSIGVITLGAIPFEGLPASVGIAGLVAAGLGAALLAIGEPTELAEVLSPIVNVVSYARIMAVLLAKGGMALAVNLLAFGAYIDQGGEGSFNFIFTPSALETVQQRADAGEVQLVFEGMTTSPEFTALGIVAGILVAIVGHIVVLLLGITAAGIQGVRLEYVEFFNKFYEGGGRPYNPFGYDRNYTTTDD